MKEGIIFWGFGIIISGLLVLAVVGTIAEASEWERFSKAHQCKVIGTISPSNSVGVGIGTNGGVSVVPVYIPGKTGYQCNDGKQYWR